jgi:cytochrome b561
VTDEARPRGSDSGAGRFTRTQIVLHWLVAALVTMQLFFNDAIQADFDRSMTGAGLDWPSPLGWLHIAGGTAILLLALWRLALRFTIGAPEAAMPAPRVAVWAGTAAHLALYGFLVMVPVTGALALLGQSDLAG